MSLPTRVEQDLIGEQDIPADAYWGVQTARAVENFPVSNTPISVMPELIQGFALVKKAAALANCQTGVLNGERCQAIIKACDLLIEGRHQDQFVVDVVQGGAGTSTNMNVNEVIANLALEQLGHEKGRYDIVHPSDHVNASQSTNDTYPTAMRLALWMALGRLDESLSILRESFLRKADAFHDILKVGRTQLQDAVPMTLGQEFLAFAVMLEQGQARLDEVRALLPEVSLGGTAIGTGINTSVAYADLVCDILKRESGVPVVKSKNLVMATQDTGVFVQLSGVLKVVATRLSKTCNDLRLLSSGPQTGFGDISLPPRQAGSSIMPGKVNPVIPEMVNQVAFEVIGNDMTITMASEAGQLQLNAFIPVMNWSLFKSIDHLSNASRILASHCVDDIVANKQVLTQRVRESVTLATALCPTIGYDKAGMIAKVAIATSKPLDQVAIELEVLTKEQLENLLAPEKLTRPN